MIYKPYAWCIFLTVALILSLMCFGAHDTLPRSSLRELADRWHRAGAAEPWRLNTTANYTLHSELAESPQPKVVEYDFTVSELTTKIDGIPRKVIGINNQYPGPLIEAVEGDTIRVKVTNQLRNSRTLLHFHGLDMNNTNYFDGSPGVTQCGIQRGRSITYEFVASPVGTYWYHGHWDTQLIMGLVGPLVVHERIPKLPATSPKDKKQQQVEPETLQGAGEDQVLVLSDLYTENAHDLLDVFLEPWIGGNIEPIPDIALAQGSQNAQMSFPAGRPVRLRLVNAASYTVFRIELESGGMTVVEADGVRTVPTKVSSLLLYPAQRYSIMVTLNSSTHLFTTPQLSLYEINDEYSLFSTDNLERSSSDLQVKLIAEQLPTVNSHINSKNSSSIISGSIRHANVKHLSQKQVEFENLVEPYFRPLFPERVPEASIMKNVNLSMTRSEEGAISGAINDLIFTFNPDESILSFIFHDLSLFDSKPAVSTSHPHHSHKDAHPKVIDIAVTPANSDRITIAPRKTAMIENQIFSVNPLHVADKIETVDFIIRNLDDGPHPMHLHGHKMWIMERGSLDENPKRFTTIYDLPIKRDVVWLPTNEWVRVRVELNNPGLWFFHCHIPWHSKTGMAAVVASQLEKIYYQLPPLEWFESCAVTRDEYKLIQNAIEHNSSASL